MHGVDRLVGILVIVHLIMDVRKIFKTYYIYKIFKNCILTPHVTIILSAPFFNRYSSSNKKYISSSRPPVYFVLQKSRSTWSLLEAHPYGPGYTYISLWTHRARIIP